MEDETKEETRERKANCRYLYVDGLLSALGTESEESFMDEINKLSRDDLIEGVRRLNKKFHEFHIELNSILIQRAAALYKIQSHHLNDSPES